MSEFLKYEQDGAIVTLTMNAPELRNALTGNAAVDEFVAAVERINADPTVRVMILCDRPCLSRDSTNFLNVPSCT